MADARWPCGDGDKSQWPQTKNQNSENARCWTLFCEENKTQAKVLLAADNRSPCHCPSHSAVLYAVLSPTLLTVIDPKKDWKILLLLFLWLDFSSSSNTEIVCKYHPKRIQAKGAKSSSPKVSFNSRPHATSHTSSMDPCAKCPAEPNRRHFVNIPHCRIAECESGFSIFHDVALVVVTRETNHLTACYSVVGRVDRSHPCEWSCRVIRRCFVVLMSASSLHHTLLHSSSLLAFMFLSLEGVHFRPKTHELDDWYNCGLVLELA